MKYITEAGIARRLKYLPYTIECGFHSGFPSCCIRFYVTKWLWLVKDLPEAIEYHSSVQKKAVELGKNWGYVPCTDCIESGRIVNVKRCPNSCPAKAYEEQAYDDDNIIVGTDENKAPLLARM